MDKNVIQFYNKLEFDHLMAIEDKGRVIVKLNEKIMLIKGKQDCIDKHILLINQLMEQSIEATEYFDFSSSLLLNVAKKYFSEKIQDLKDQFGC